MAKLLVEVDTEARTLKASVDGVEISEIRSIYVWNYEDDEPHFEVMTIKHENKVSTRVHIMAKVEEDVKNFLC